MYKIENVRLYVRETGPARFPFALGAKGAGGAAPARQTSPLIHVRLELRDDAGHATFGCAADRMSVRWLDKRPGRGETLKLRELAALVEFAARTYLAEPSFASPFDRWHSAYQAVLAEGRARGQEDLTSAFAAALLERAMLDGVSRLAGQPLFAMLRDDRLGFRPERVHAELAGVRLADVLPPRPRTRLFVRHTVGPYDPLSDAELPDADRVRDGLPETLAESIERYGLLYFKVKITGDIQRDLVRLSQIWDVLPQEKAPVVTLDANEAFDDPERLSTFVDRLEDEQLGLFQHIAYIEQPLSRELTFAPGAQRWIRRIGARKPVIIDESDATLGDFLRARKLGYAGTSHKNCKGVVKSLLTRCLLARIAETDDDVLLSAEDLQNLPLVPVQQDFVTVGTLGLSNCERNGHHYNVGLSMVSPRERESVARHHRDLYVFRDGQWYLRIEEGQVRCDSLQCPGFGVYDEPDWGSMETLPGWLARLPAGD